MFEPENNPYCEKPLLLVFDDFEQNIPEAQRKQARVAYQPESLRVLDTVLQAIHDSHSDTRVIITSRFEVPVNLPCRLHKENPQGLRYADLEKKLAQLPGLQTADHGEPQDNDEEALRQQALEIAAGNPRLLEWLDNVLQNRGQLSVSELFDQLQSKEAEFREDVLIEALVEAQPPAIRRTLACAALYQLPVPLAAVGVLTGNDDTAQHLQTAAGFGLVEISERVGDQQYFVSNLLDVALATELALSEKQRLAAKASQYLYSNLEDETSEAMQQEILRLAILGTETQIAEEAAANLVASMLPKQRFREMDILCKKVLNFTESPVMLSYQGMTQMLLGAGEANAEQSFERARQLLNDDPTQHEEQEEAIMLNWVFYASLLIQKGKLEDAQHLLSENAMPLAEKLDSPGFKAVIFIKLAEISQTQGEIEEAIRFYQSAQSYSHHIYDPSAKPYIEMQLATIEQSRGEFDGALAQYYEKLAVFDEQNNLQQKARTLGQIADILWHQDANKHESSIQQLLKEALDTFILLKLPAEKEWIESFFDRQEQLHEPYVDSASSDNHLAQISVSASPQNIERVISRNTLCVCGSGKRYKHCCGKLV